MDFNDYQQKSRKTAAYPAIGHAVIYPTLGLVNEAGEVAGKVKKVFRDKEGQISPRRARRSSPNWGTCCGTSPRSAPNSISASTTWRRPISPSSTTGSSGARSRAMAITGK